MPKKSIHVSAYSSRKLDPTPKLGPIEYRLIGSLTPFAGNPRQHSEDQLTKLCASMRQFGFAIPVLIDGAGVIIAGEARIEAAHRLGLKTAPVIVARHWSEAQVRAYRLTDNKLSDLASFDFEALAIEMAAIIEIDDSTAEVVGWDSDEIGLILQTDDFDSQIDVCERPRRSRTMAKTITICSQGDIWLLGGHKLHCATDDLAFLDKVIDHWEVVSGGRAVHANSGVTFARARAQRQVAGSATVLSTDPALSN